MQPKISIKSNYCPTHLILLNKCTVENCTFQSFCRLCDVNSKEGLKHMYEHFDFIENEKIIADLSSLKAKMKEEEIYTEYNKVYLEMAQQLSNIIEASFNEIQRSRNVIIEQCSEALIVRYEEATTNFEKLIKKLSEKIESITSTEYKIKAEITKLKADLDEMILFFSDHSKIESKISDFIKKAESKLLNLKICDLKDNKFSFNTRGIPCVAEWVTGGRVYTTAARGGYTTCKSVETFSGAFTAKVKVVSINSYNAGNNWYYSIGLMRANSINDSSYYMDSCIFMSTGYLGGAFSGSNGIQLFSSPWKSGDILIITRDEKNDVYFGVNDENNLKPGFTSIVGEYKLILGFISSVSGDTFELLEMEKY